MRVAVLFSAVFVVAGCGFAGVATHADGTAEDAGLDGPGASRVDGSTDVPGAGSSEVPIEGLDAGAVVDGGADASARPRFEIVAPSGGKFRILTSGGVGNACSIASGQQATFVVKNLSAETVRVLWIDYACLAQDYGSANSGNSRSQPTFVSHRWRIRSAGGGTLGEFVLDAPGTYQVIVR